MSTDDGPCAVEPAELGEVDTCFRCGDVYLATAPDESAFELAARRGFALVLDLRSESAVREASMARDVRRLGLDYVRVAIEPSALDDAAIDEVLRMIEAANGPVLLFCDQGTRCATVFAVYRAVVQGVDLETALEDGRFVGMKPGTEEAVRAQVTRLRKDTASSASATSASATSSI
ncbi:MAG: sulfur transferase domain-containing protein [Planctomycetota bacterium]